MDSTSIIYITAEAIVGLLTFVGNLLVLVAIFRTRQLQTETNCFIASLATADMLVGLVVAPLAATSFVGWPHNFLGCVFTNSIVVAFTQVSIFNLLAVAIERFFAIKHPFAYQKHMTMRKAIGVNGIVWCVGLLFGFLPVFGWNLRDQVTDEWTCNFVTVIDMEYVVYFHFFGCIIVPLIIIVAIYFYIFLIVRRQMSQIAALEISAPNQQPSSSSSRFKREIKAAKSLAIVILLFGLCWIPIHVLNTMSLFCPQGCYPYQLLLFTIVLSHANSAVNPFLYAYGNSHFKNAFRKMYNRHYIDENASTFVPSVVRAKNNKHELGNNSQDSQNILVNTHQKSELPPIHHNRQNLVSHSQGTVNNGLTLDQTKKVQFNGNIVTNSTSSVRQNSAEQEKVHLNNAILAPSTGNSINNTENLSISNSVGQLQLDSPGSSSYTSSSSVKPVKMEIYTLDSSAVPLDNVTL